MIIVEGPDGAGKTTLIDHLVEHTGLPIAPRVVTKDAEAMVDLKQWVDDNLDGGFQATIFDRHRLFSELVYGPLLRTSPEPGFEDKEWVFSRLSGLYRIRPIIIYCLPPLELVWDNVKDDGDNRVVADYQTIRRIWSSYATRAMVESIHNGHAWVYDYSNEPQATYDRSSFISRINHRVKMEGY